MRPQRIRAASPSSSIRATRCGGRGASQRPSGRVAGRQDAVTLKDASGMNTTHCDGTSLMATVTPTAARHRNATVKFVLVRTDGSRAVLTLVVHVGK